MDTIFIFVDYLKLHNGTRIGRIFSHLFDFSFGIKVFFIEITPILKLESVKIRRIRPIRVPFIKTANVVFLNLISEIFQSLSLRFRQRFETQIVGMFDE